MKNFADHKIVEPYSFDRGTKAFIKLIDTLN